VDAGADNDGSALNANHSRNLTAASRIEQRSIQAMKSSTLPPIRPPR
jgi:hypothetical protein